MNKLTKKTHPHRENPKTIEELVMDGFIPGKMAMWKTHIIEKYDSSQVESIWSTLSVIM